MRAWLALGWLCGSRIDEWEWAWMIPFGWCLSRVLGRRAGFQGHRGVWRWGVLRGCGVGKRNAIYEL
jgi:hypothetical protein